MFRRAPVWVLTICALTLFTVTGAAQAHGYKIKLARTYHVHVPAEALANGWCYDGIVIDRATQRVYLADASNKRIDVIRPRSGRVSTIGAGKFSGIGGCYTFTFNAMGPDGLAITGGNIFAGNGNSHVLGFSLATGKQIANTNTGGKLQADDMAVAGKYLIVTNPAEAHPFLSFIKLKGKHTVAARYTVRNATGGFGQLRYWHGHLYLPVSTSKASPVGGEIDEYNIANIHKVKRIRRFKFSVCQPAGLSITPSGAAAVGCGNGGSQEILNVRTGKQTAVPGIIVNDQVGAFAGDFFFVSAATNQFYVVNRAGKIMQTFNNVNSHALTVNPSNGDVWVPGQGGDVYRYNPVHPLKSASANGSPASLTG